ncbi:MULTISPECIES: NAD-dependent 4,6-dehydratase LegB [unclassified Rhizobium]|uniref:NAD-dependent 4,6-dehydratase LegB n=1 Tax=unclassified Rhizobium TaxID=2613769 RepID=UPI001C839D02|nr:MULTISPECIES: NAD-dependent 4,6-dehydratase LegB [unclassified Rhizobium]MBX5214126.1 SDR family NAD(P)-dependent oxidoreductase [Rhizobium sp. NLR9a]MBX5233132.1 SDR family NAD(P)-dependent oxidoreductase [Rhizobium sp. NLR4a]MBX5245814.1 SDR family NAD(P)-dependent oxidoreductase [Rhizobium sp. NLR3b]MBX5269195.1 SDR family NAD(P)-dependent oxidoreductase [Rhizobium sp. NLR17b]MBX5273948.1 SDR family NAD(P)-dependent oxidoreductase [Rhizobium sp. NLR13a]
MKKVLVTGADGFIGSHLVETLVRSGVEVRALCQYNSFSSWGWLDQSEHRGQFEVILGDVRDPSQMRTVAKGVDTVFHLAALIAIPYSYQAPSSYIDTNVHGTLNVLQGALDAGAGRVIQTSTSEVYGTARFVPISESHPLQAQSPYSASKIGADAIAYSYYSSFDLPVTIARPFNTFGPRQSARAVIPTVISQLLSGRTTLKLGALSPTRDFNFVQDTCDGFLALAACDQAIGQTVNIGSGSEISIGDTVQLIADIIGVSVEIECDEQRLRPANSEVERLCCDNSLIKSLTGFSPRYSVEDGLKATIEWLRQPQNLARYKADIFNV